MDMDKEALRLEIEAAFEIIQHSLDEAVLTMHDFLDEPEPDEMDILPGDCSFPIVWSVSDHPCDGEGGDPIEDPMVLRVHSADEDTDPNTKYEISLQDAVSSLIEMLIVDEDLKLVAMQVRDALSELSDQITIALDAHW
jgi:hypothetical protein